MQNEDIAEALAVRRADDQRRKQRPPAFGAPYGNTSSYTPASDLSTAPFVPAAENYSPPATEPRYEGDGLGSFDK